MVFVESPTFTAQVAELLTDDEYATFQWRLAQHPDAGGVIAGSGGLRKIRVAAKGHGKRSGARVIYYHFVAASQIGLLLIYPKNAQADLTAAQKAALKRVIENWR